ncbi:MAG: YggT family protein [Anaerolineae bacterium]
MISLYRLINLVFWLLDLAILLRVLFSWINPDPGNALVHLVYQVTEPILAPLRRVIPPFAGLDITPIIALFLLELLQRLLVSLIF